ncbi:hypothetical protein QBC32DRAFT_341567 [Pseudoneurospora amorphoporcata]|uniref:Myb-like domain-containing protein n=1 Tax=Pseudoneurospora amorphoporcata TaxID=241081 RepID=A0AAN6NUY5_9PEZI|nr:hypothetical protein QBC32DRAFT_341567 [Pseudoneurospora amorphoporcata]
MGWNVPQPGRAMNGAQVYDTPAYNAQGGPRYMGQHSDIHTNGSPYAVQHTYPSPPMPYGNWQPQTPYEMDAGTHAGQASHPHLHYLRGANSPALQVQHNVVSPSQLTMNAPGLGPNNMLHFNATGYPSAPNPAGFANARTSDQHSNELDSNPKGWTKDQDALVYHLKTNKVKVKHIGAELKRRFNVERSDNAVSKRWKNIKQRSSGVGSEDVVQNVMPPSLQLLKSEVERVVPGFENAAQNYCDPQLSEIVDEAEKGFQKGYAKLVEEYMFNMQRVQAQAQAQAQAQPQGLQGRRHGDANL